MCAQVWNTTSGAASHWSAGPVLCSYWWRACGGKTGGKAGKGKGVWCWFPTGGSVPPFPLPHWPPTPPRAARDTVGPLYSTRCHYLRTCSSSWYGNRGPGRNFIHTHFHRKRVQEEHAGGLGKERRRIFRTPSSRLILGSLVVRALGWCLLGRRFFYSFYSISLLFRCLLLHLLWCLAISQRTVNVSLIKVGCYTGVSYSSLRC